jgi:hypothetical protein
MMALSFASETPMSSATTWMECASRGRYSCSGGSSSRIVMGTALAILPPSPHGLEAARGKAGGVR